MPLWPVQKPLPSMHTNPNTAHWHEVTGLAPLMTSGAWTAANRIVYTPVVMRDVWAGGIAIYNGASVSGLGVLGIYAMGPDGKPGAAMLRLAPYAQEGPSVFQSPFGARRVRNEPFELSPSGWTLPAGTYWLAAAFDNTTAEVIRLAALTANRLGEIANIYYEESASLELPDTATPLAASLTLNVPVMSLLV